MKLWLIFSITIFISLLPTKAIIHLQTTLKLNFMHHNCFNQSLSQYAPVSFSCLLQVPPCVAWSCPSNKTWWSGIQPRDTSYDLTAARTSTRRDVTWAARGGYTVYLLACKVSQRWDWTCWIQVRLWALNPAHIWCLTGAWNLGSQGSERTRSGISSSFLKEASNDLTGLQRVSGWI